MPNFVIQVPPGEHPDFVSYLAGSNSNHCFARTRWRFKTPGTLFWQYPYRTCQLMWHLRELRGARTMVVFSHFGFAVKLLARGSACCASANSLYWLLSVRLRAA